MERENESVEIVEQRVRMTVMDAIHGDEGRHWKASAGMRHRFDFLHAVSTRTVIHLIDLGRLSRDSTKASDRCQRAMLSGRPVLKNHIGCQSAYDREAGGVSVRYSIFDHGIVFTKLAVQVGSFSLST